jgi:hypothetical protein
MVALVFGAACAPAMALAATTSQAGATQTARSAILQNDFEIGGQVAATVLASGLPAQMDLNVSGLPLHIVLDGQTQIQVGPYAANPTFVVAGAAAKVWFHVDNNGQAIADLVVLTPTVVKGTVVSDQNLDSQDPTHGQVLGVDVATPSSGGSGQVVNVDVVPGTTVRILPPWDASQGLSGVDQVAAVGVMEPSGALMAAMVVGVVSQSHSHSPVKSHSQTQSRPRSPAQSHAH